MLIKPKIHERKSSNYLRYIGYFKCLVASVFHLPGKKISFMNSQIFWIVIYDNVLRVECSTEQVTSRSFGARHNHDASISVSNCSLWGNIYRIKVNSDCEKTSPWSIRNMKLSWSSDFSATWVSSQFSCWGVPVLAWRMGFHPRNTWVMLIA